tara:strand:- start:1951 stop:2103 length:153 start_codon:yes stop_codon:yes gene_type:complete
VQAKREGQALRRRREEKPPAAARSPALPKSAKDQGPEECQSLWQDEAVIQ